MVGAHTVWSSKPVTLNFLYQTSSLGSPLNLSNLAFLGSDVFDDKLVLINFIITHFLSSVDGVQSTWCHSLLEQIPCGKDHTT